MSTQAPGPPDGNPAASAGSESANHEVLTGVAEYALRALQVIAAARVELALFTYAMDRRVFGSEAFVEAVKVFALRHRRARLRVLIHTPVQVMRGHHRLVELGRRLPSRIDFRELPAERRNHFEEYFIADEVSFVHKRLHDALEARYFARAPLDAREQLRTFNVFWDESVPARELSILGI